METDQELSTHTQGQQFQNAERMVLIAKLVELLSEGYMTTYALSKKLKIPQETINTYRVLADKLIGENKIDRNVIRNLQIKRTYVIIENLMKDVKELKGVKYTKERSMLYNNIYKFSSHLALITGLNVETHVNIDPTKLVIIRANQKKQQDRVIEASDDTTNTIVQGE